MIDLGIASVAGITIICYLFGMIGRAAKFSNDWIPIICGVSGAILGVVAFYIGMIDFPGQDVINSVGIGIVSGIAATGLDQVVKKVSSLTHSDK